MDLSIRRMRKEDLCWLYRLLSDPEVMRWLEPPYSMEQTEAFLFYAGLSENPLIYAAEEQGVPIGYVIDHPYDEHSREIGWVLLPEYWGRGYASALTDLLIQRAGQERRQLVIECAPQQQATKCVAVRKGFRYQGLIDGLDVFRFRLLPRRAFPAGICFVWERYSTGLMCQIFSLYSRMVRSEEK